MESASVSTTILVNTILCAAALVASLTGFGYALIAMPFLVLLFPPAQVVPLVLISWAPIAVFLVAECRRHVSPARLARLLAGAVVGAPVGIYGLTSLSPGTMRAVVGAISLLAVAILLVRPSRPLTREGVPLLGAGLLSGLLGGASAMSGPPVVLLGLNQRWSHESFRADLLWYIFILHTTIAIAFGNIGLLSGTTLRMGVWSLPGVLAGFGAGMWLKPRVNAEAYRRLAVGLVAAGGVLALVGH